MATSPFAHHKMLCLAEQLQQKRTRTTATGHGSLPYSNLQTEIKCSDDKNTLTHKTREQPLIFKKYDNSYFTS